LLENATRSCHLALAKHCPPTTIFQPLEAPHSI
jgi:hypothetical protein